MNRFKMSVGQRRFLIIWVIFHSVALLMNITKIEGTVHQSLPENGTTGYQINLFTSFQPDSDLWPFVAIYHSEYESQNLNTYGDIVYFKGIFFGYNAISFLFYILVGFGIVYVPKLWNDQTSDTIKN